MKKSNNIIHYKIHPLYSDILAMRDDARATRVTLSSFIDHIILYFDGYSEHRQDSVNKVVYKPLGLTRCKTWSYQDFLSSLSTVFIIQVLEDIFQNKAFTWTAMNEPVAA